MTSEYGLDSGPIHSSRSRIRASTGSDVGAIAESVYHGPEAQRRVSMTTFVHAQPMLAVGEG
jgi:hypothetical protein